MTDDENDYCSAEEEDDSSGLAEMFLIPFISDLKSLSKVVSVCVVRLPDGREEEGGQGEAYDQPEEQE